jgi:uncharacterized protein involved in cysteine biosynthesis
MILLYNVVEIFDLAQFAGFRKDPVILKALYIMLLGALFWMICELVKHMVNVLAKLIVAALRYLAIVVRGWPKNSEEGEEGSGEGKSIHK